MPGEAAKAGVKPQMERREFCTMLLMVFMDMRNEVLTHFTRLLPIVLNLLCVGIVMMQRLNGCDKFCLAYDGYGMFECAGAGVWWSIMPGEFKGKDVTVLDVFEVVNDNMRLEHADENCILSV